MVNQSFSGNFVGVESGPSRQSAFGTTSTLGTIQRSQSFELASIGPFEVCAVMLFHLSLPKVTVFSMSFKFAVELTCCLVLFGGVSSATDVDFDAQVRPILSEKCFHCHGPDPATREADLRLDTAEGAFADLGGYAAFVVGKPGESKAIDRIHSVDPDEVMPPPDSKLTLSENEKTILKQWVQSGASWSEHWSFVPPARPIVPADSRGWSVNEIDRFVAANILVAGLKPSPPAGKAELLRRVTLDLTGLPPTLDEIDAFVSNKSANAYEDVVDRLLASPHYGERMAWEWLDAARYADTDGFQGDPTRTMWPWRDWLVDALNDNMSFDQFTIEMLAGDLLDNATADQILATGFNRNHMFNGEGGRIAEETRVENVFDRAETTGTVWLGLTMTCCRCHDHKYDPISQKDYFQLYAFFNNTSETGRSGRGKTAPVLQYIPTKIRQRQDELSKQIQRLNAELTAADAALDRQQAAWEVETAKKIQANKVSVVLGDWWQLGPIALPGKQAFDKDLGPEKQVDLQARVADAEWRKSPKNQDGKVFALPETVGATYFYRTIQSSTAARIALSFGSDDAIKVFLNGKEVVANFAARAAAADQELLEVELPAGISHLLVKIVNTGGIGGFYFRKVSESVYGLPISVVNALKVPSAQRTPDQLAEIQADFRSKNSPDWRSAKKQQVKLQRQLDPLNNQAVTVMVMDDLSEAKRRKTMVLGRGAYDKVSDVEVSADTPSVLPPLPDGVPRDRLSLAKWLVDPANPLTARVTVNRSWQTFFGKGIVKSTEDFGSQGNRPTHPELLDWLALEFINSGWDVKHIHKLIVMSSTYRQATTITEQAMEKDPENTWLARSSRHRLPSWMLRDQALAISGLLNPESGGASVRPYQPDGIWAEATFGKIRYKRDDGEKLYRRSLYIFWRRIVGPTMFFDGAKRQTCEVKSTITNTPLHALTTLNETSFVEAARVMAERVIASTTGQQQRLKTAFQMATARQATQPEMLVLSARIDSLRQDFAANPGDALELLAVGQSPRNEALDPAEHAAYSVVCSILLNLDETLSR